MKIKVLMAFAVLPLLAFECCDDTDTWQFRCQRGSEFTLYPQDVLEEVIGESLMSLNFVQSVIDSHNGSPSLGKPWSYEPASSSCTGWRKTDVLTCGGNPQETD